MFIVVREDPSNGERKFLRLWNNQDHGCEGYGWARYAEAAQTFSTEGEAVSWVQQGRLVDGVLVCAGQAYMPGFTYRVEPRVLSEVKA